MIENCSTVTSGRNVVKQTKMVTKKQPSPEKGGFVPKQKEEKTLKDRKFKKNSLL
jgi:hypothetical protein